MTQQSTNVLACTCNYNLVLRSYATQYECTAALLAYALKLITEHQHAHHVASSTNNTAQQQHEQ
jgi:hypothetical protein